MERIPSAAMQGRVQNPGASAGLVGEHGTCEDLEVHQATSQLTEQVGDENHRGKQESRERSLARERERERREEECVEEFPEFKEVRVKTEICRLGQPVESPKSCQRLVRQPRASERTLAILGSEIGSPFCSCLKLLRHYESGGSEDGVDPDNYTNEASTCIMSTINSSDIHLSSFRLMGFPGNEAGSIWMSLPLSLLYLLSILANCLILFIIRIDHQLSEPMFRLLSLLAANDLALTLSTLPTVLGVFWFQSNQIPFYACLIQLYFMHSLCSLGSAILVAMAFDRYIAICNPLRYASILHPIIAKIGLVALVRGAGIHFPIPFLLNRLPYCASNALSHAFCYQSDVMRLACADTTINSMYGLVLVLTTYLLDLVFILFSYAMIQKTVRSRATQEERWKALNTCVSHLCVVLLFYTSLFGLTLAHRYGRNGSPFLLVLMGLALFIVPPALNPKLYSIKNKQIRSALRKRVCTKKRPHM
ncbi:olfactory receptor 51G2-like [Ambystoma mexicanum]|uniref:olfactory receptor 51G2-like n=1 Tax=Ambystoma mexicanum TaxID=8296 RepID=UPI0037E74626